MARIVEIVDSTHERARGTAATTVVVDVIRAFTTAAAALDAGARRVVCVETVAAAQELAASRPGALLAGEEWGLPPAGFHAGNSPLELAAAPVAGRDVVLRSQNGTAALAAAVAAPRLLAAGLVNVSATARWIGRHGDREVTIVCSSDGDEDRACAEQLAEALAGRAPGVHRARLRAAAAEHVAVWRRFHEPAAVRAFERDVEACLTLDVYDFAMLAASRVPLTLQAA
jgi:2-phosphosulfolactate phosphatase